MKISHLFDTSSLTPFMPRTACFAEADAAEATGGGGGAEGGEATPSIDDTMAAVFDRMENGDRDDSGKFKGADGAKAGDDATTTDATAATDTDAGKDSTDQSASKQAPGAAKPTDAPTSWSAEDKAVFAKAPPEIQAAILKRETERDNLLTQKTQEIANERKTYETYKPLIAPIEAEARKIGLTADVAIRQLYERHLDISQNGIEGLKRLAGIYGIQLPAGDIATEYTDPETAALKSKLDNVERTLTGWQKQQYDNAIAQGMSEIDTVRLEKASDGTPLRPHFEALYDEMLPIAQMLKQKNPSWSTAKVTTEAYDRAARANPEIWAKVEGEKKAKEKAEAEKKAKEAAAAAKKSAANNTRSSSAHPGAATAGKSIEDTMSRVYDRMSA